MDRQLQVAVPAGEALQASRTLAPAGLAVKPAATASTLTRRRLLLLGGAAALGAGGMAALSGGASVVGVRGPRRSDYVPYVGRSFRLLPERGPSLAVRLVRIDDFPGRAQRRLAGSEAAFILIFRAGAGEPRPGQAVLLVVGPGGARRRLLLSPTGPGRGAVEYAAVVNRLIPHGGTTHV